MNTINTLTCPRQHESLLILDSQRTRLNHQSDLLVSFVTRQNNHYFGSCSRILVLDFLIVVAAPAPRSMWLMVGIAWSEPILKCWLALGRTVEQGRCCLITLYYSTMLYSLQSHLITFSKIFGFDLRLIWYSLQSSDMDSSVSAHTVGVGMKTTFEASTAQWSRCQLEVA